MSYKKHSFMLRKTLDFLFPFFALFSNLWRVCRKVRGLVSVVVRQTHRNFQQLRRRYAFPNGRNVWSCQNVISKSGQHALSHITSNILISAVSQKTKRKRKPQNNTLNLYKEYPSRANKHRAAFASLVHVAFVSPSFREIVRTFTDAETCCNSEETDPRTTDFAELEAAEGTVAAALAATAITSLES
jgi:hypothetical protein